MISTDAPTSLGAVPASDPSGGKALLAAGTGVWHLLALAVIAAVVGALTLSFVAGPNPAVRPATVGGAPADEGFPGNAMTKRDGLARETLRRQEQALNAAEKPAYLHTWDSGLDASRRRAASVYENLEALHANVSSTRYMAHTIGELPLRQQSRLGGTAWTAQVQLSWRLDGFDDRHALATLMYTFVQRGDAAYVVDIVEAAGARTPVWLLGSLDVRRSERTLVAAVSPGDPTRIYRHLQQAASDVTAVISDWNGGLVAYVPADVSQMEALGGAAPGAFSNIAAVTTTVDGSRESNSPVAIVVNPAVFDGLGQLGAHVVITHESTHAATGATTVDLPLWVAEGFADYVAVGSVHVPLEMSTNAVTREIRRRGLPDALPADAAFGSAQRNLEVSYEQAWLAARLIARDYGQTRLVELHERLVAHPHRLDHAVREILHTTVLSLTASWRNYLRTIASAS